MTDKLEIKLLSDNATLPKRTDDLSAGYDIYAAETVTLKPQDKAFDKVRSFITKRLKEEETTDEYDYGERFMCEEIKRLWEDE